MGRPKKTPEGSSKTPFTLKEFLKMPEADRPSLLREKTLPVKLFSGVDMEVTVRQLTKQQSDHYQRRISQQMPEVPYVEHDVRVAQRQPDGTVKPAGKYKEQNSKDPNYMRSMELWFNDSCVWLVLYSIHGSLEVPFDSSELDDLYTKVNTLLPPDALQMIAVAAAHCNPGLAIAEQILQSHIANALNSAITSELLAASSEQ